MQLMVRGKLKFFAACSGHFQNASRCFQAVLEKDKTHPGALINYGALLVHLHGSSFAGLYLLHPIIHMLLCAVGCD